MNTDAEKSGYRVGYSHTRKWENRSDRRSSYWTMLVEMLMLMKTVVYHNHLAREGIPYPLAVDVRGMGDTRPEVGRGNPGYPDSA